MNITVIGYSVKGFDSEILGFVNKKELTKRATLTASDRNVFAWMDLFIHMSQLRFQRNERKRKHILLTGFSVWFTVYL